MRGFLSAAILSGHDAAFSANNCAAVWWWEVRISYRDKYDFFLILLSIMMLI